MLDRYVAVMAPSFERPESLWIDFDGPVHYVDHGGPSDGPVMVCVHGLGGSLINWFAVAPLLTERYRVLALDLAGFGHTQGGERPTSVHANRRLLDRFLTEVAGTPAVLVGNSMGGLISILQAAKAPQTVAGLVLIDPALPVGLASRPDPGVAAIFGAATVPAVARRLLDRRRRGTSAEQAALQTLRLCTADVNRIPKHVVDLHVELAVQRREYPDVDAELLAAAQSLVWVLLKRRRYTATQRAITAPVLLLHGDRDRLVPITSARAAAKANPSWRLRVAHGVGHVPQLEVPDWVAEQIHEWLCDHPGVARAAVRATAHGPVHPPGRSPRDAAAQTAAGG